MSVTKRTVRLADLDAALEPVELPSGRVCQVKPIDAIGEELTAQLRETGDNRLLWPIVQRCLPDAPPEEVQALSATMAMAVVAIARGHAETVLALVAEGKTTGETATPPTSSSSPATP